MKLPVTVFTEYHWGQVTLRQKLGYLLCHGGCLGVLELPPMEGVTMSLIAALNLCVDIVLIANIVADYVPVPCSNLDGENKMNQVFRHLQKALWKRGEVPCGCIMFDCIRGSHRVDSILFCRVGFSKNLKTCLGNILADKYPLPAFCQRQVCF